LSVPKFKPARILAIETSCDETACAILQDGRMLLSTAVASQMELHARYGGVFPEVASRQHVLSIIPVVQDALSMSHLTLRDIDALAVTRGPGLAGSLVVGVNMAKGLALGTGLPLVAVNHLEGHIYSAWVFRSGDEPPPQPEFPLVALIVSGGHTELDLITDHLAYRRLGSTRDDAAGEAFDKVARLLGLGYPGGPAIERAAQQGDPDRFHFPRAWMEGTSDFSFSGLKTSVLYAVRDLERRGNALPAADLAASFQAAVVDVLFKKTIQAANEHRAAAVLVAGGVAANHALRSAFKSQAEFPVHIPPLSLCTDNAAMIAAAGYYRYSSGQVASLDLDVAPTWPLS
jgi:N6-L-threonylcarbamoyladenine synthase